MNHKEFNRKIFHIESDVHLPSYVNKYVLINENINTFWIPRRFLADIKNRLYYQISDQCTRQYYLGRQ